MRTTTCYASQINTILIISTQLIKPLIETNNYRVQNLVCCCIKYLFCTPPQTVKRLAEYHSKVRDECKQKERKTNKRLSIHLSYMNLAH